MKVRPTALPEVLLVEPVLHRDARGGFFEVYHRQRFAEAGLPADFPQDNHSWSKRDVLRGLHAQRVNAQGKLVRAARGAILDVAVDIRRGSPRFGQHVAVTLSEDNHRQLYIPPGFAHGFLVTSGEADVLYKCTALYAAGEEITIAWDDPDIAIPWPCEAPILSDKDRDALPLAAQRDGLPLFESADETPR